MRRNVQMGLWSAGVLVLKAAPGWAATGTTLATAVTEFDGLFRLGLYILGLAGLMTIAYVVARNRYGVVWDEAIAVVIAAAIGGSAVTMLSWVGVTAAAELPLPLP